MSYNNYNNNNYNRNNNGGSYNRNSSGNYSGAGYNNNRSSYSQASGGNNGRGVRKKSGAKAGSSVSHGSGEIKPWVSGWKKTQTGLLSIICGPYKKTDTYTSEKGTKWQTWLANVQPPNGAQSYRLPCRYYMASGRVIIDGLGFVINPKARNGGYCGTFVNKGN